MRPAATLSRRSVLALAVLTVAGCRHKSAPPAGTAPMADAPAFSSAIASEQALIAACEARGLTEEASIHSTHLTALGGQASTASPPAAPNGSLRSMLRRNAAMLRGAAISAVDGDHAAVFASIAASHLVSAG